MKSVFLALLLLSSVSFAQTTDSTRLLQKDVDKTIKEISSIIKKNALISDSLDWDTINKETQNISAEIKVAEDYKLIYKYFTDQFRKAGDKHSFFLTPDRISKIKNGTAEAEQAASKYLGDEMGYIKVPSCLNFDAGKDRDFANNIRLEIKKVDTENLVTSWVVDLRHNTGGNMWPILAGLNALMDDGTVGYFVFKNGDFAWKTKNGKMLGSKDIDDYKIKNLKVKIAVLIDSMTASSGEMTAVTFSGLPNVKFFGTPSAGYTTANNTNNLSNGAQLNLASSFVADRNKKAFRDKMIPDVIIENDEAGNDKVLDVAKAWLKESR